MTLVLPLAGVALLGLLAVDVFSTVFSPYGRGGPLNRRQNRAIWALFRRLGRRRDGSVRARWLALAGPVMVVSAVGVWLVTLLIGFAVIYYPWIESFLVSPGALRTPWVETVYYSGYTAATLGSGDVVPDSEALRLLAPVEALGGFALLSASVTYSLAVYRELIRRQALAADIANHFEGDGSFAPVATGGGGSAALARWSDAASRSLMEVELAHFQYPVLHYFRSTSRRHALPAQLEHLVRLRRLVRDAEPSNPIAMLADDPSYRALERSLEEYLRMVDDLFTPRDRERSEAAESGDPSDAAYRHLRAYMLYR